MEKKRTRKGLACLLALCLCLTLLPAAAWAVGGDTGGNDTAGGGDGTAGGSDNTGPSGGETPVYTWDGLIDKINGNDSTITLMNNMAREDGAELLIPENRGSLTIDLHGYTLDTSGTVITVSKGATLTIENEPGKTAPGKITGGIRVNGGGTLILADDVEISGHTAENGGGIYVASGGDVTIQDYAKITGHTATNDTATATGGGIYVEGDGKVTIQGHAAIISNSASKGGGIYADGTVTILGDAKITGNTATGVLCDGGGI